MENAEAIKQIVREKYSAIAEQPKSVNDVSCCGATSCCTSVDYTIFSESYTAESGYVADADLGLGCGIPTQFAKINTGDVVLDLGSGAGNDCFVARALTGETGKVIGVDMTPAMLEKARDNAEKLNFHNVEFRLGEIEHLPIGGNRIDVVLSNCVLNLVPDKQKAFQEIYRVLKPGGHFSISDVVTNGILPHSVQQVAELYAGCVAGAIPKFSYLDLIKNAGFINIRVEKEKQIIIPQEILSAHLPQESLEELNQSETGIYSVTIYGEKSTEASACCDPQSGCC